jgi:serine/threonine-protein kinase
MSQSDNPEVFKFGKYRLDADNVLFRDDEVIHLPPKELAVLKVLLESDGRVIGKQELIDSVWAAAVVSDDSLIRCIYVLRKTLGEGGKDQRYIATISRRGYRFAMPVHRISNQRIRKKARDHELLLAVLPFESQSSDREQEYFCDGLTEEIIARLTRLHAHGIHVVARSAIMFYRNSGKSLDQIGRELKLDFAITGRVRMLRGERVRIRVELVRLSDQVQIWSELYDSPWDEVLALQSDIAARIAGSLPVSLSHLELSHIRKVFLTSSQAYEAYLQARYHWNKRNHPDMRRALVFYRQAIALDAAYAPAYAGLADCYNLMANRGYIPPQQARREVRPLLDKALTLDDQLAATHAALGRFKWNLEWDARGGEQALLRALAIDSNYASAHHHYGTVLFATHRFEQAIDAFERSLELDPFSLGTSSFFGWILFCSGRYQAAFERARKTLELEPDYPDGHILLAILHGYFGDKMQAIAAADKALAMLADNTQMMTYIAYAYLLGGNRRRMRTILGEIEKIAHERYVPAAKVAAVYAAAENHEQAYAWLDRAYRERCCWLPWADVDPRFETMRTQPHFTALMKRVTTN